MRSRDDCNKNRIAVKFSNDTSGRRVEVARRQESIEKEVPSVVVVCMCGRERAKRERTNERKRIQQGQFDEWPSQFHLIKLPHPLFTQLVTFFFSPSSSKLAFITNRKWLHISPMRKQQKKKMRNNFSIDKTRSKKERKKTIQ